MKKLILFLMLACLLLAATAVAEESIPARYLPILESWNATNAEELYLNILDYLHESASTLKKVYTTKRFPYSIRLGGTTDELIADKENWDMAVVSSKEVDLQALADEQMICIHGHNPQVPVVLHQWLLAENIQSLLPSDPLLYYHVYVYDYDEQTDDATFLICQTYQENFAAEIMRLRPADSVRALEGISRVDAWTERKLLTAASVNVTTGNRPIDAWTEEDLIANAEEWDVALIMTDTGDKLETLDAAGLLFDFSVNDYFPSRDSIRPYSYECELPNGVFSADGRMIGIPCLGRGQDDKNTESVLILNAKSPHLEQAQAYAVHFIKSKVWNWTAEGKMWPFGYGVCIYKDEMDW